MECATTVWQGGDVVADRVGEFVGRHMPMAVGIEVVAPPRHDQPALFKEFGLLAYLTFNVVTALPHQLLGGIPN